MIARSSMQSRRTLSINIPVALTITKGTSNVSPDVPLLMYMVAISPSFIQQNPNESGTCGVNTMHRWTIASICKRSLTVGDIMPTVLLRHNQKSKFSRRSEALFCSIHLPLNGIAASRAHSAGGRGNRELPVCELFAMKLKFLILATTKVPGDREDFSAPTPALGGDIRIRFLKNHFESHQF
jgi:hypothetical protein